MGTRRLSSPALEITQDVGDDVELGFLILFPDLSRQVVQDILVRVINRTPLPIDLQERCWMVTTMTVMDRPLSSPAYGPPSRPGSGD